MRSIILRVSYVCVSVSVDACHMQEYPMSELIATGAVCVCVPYVCVCYTSVYLYGSWS